MNVEEGECNTCVANKYKIHNYSTKVPQLLSFKNEYKNAKNPVYFGCELEFETLDRDKAKIEVGKRISGYAIMKNDSSINNGFEVVTCPATFGIHMKAMEHLFTNLSNNVYAQSNTGMHVHISKKPLSVLTIGKITEFLNRESNKDFIKSVAGRISSYAQIDPYKTVTYPFVMGAGHRYSAVNLNNSDTIEIRIFATPENFYQFAYRFEFCKALVDYCMPAGVSVKSLKDLTHFETFTNWVKQNRPFYPNLYKFVQQGVTI
jgi:hypothetical protein